MPKVIIVAGGSGFIGSHLCAYLLKKKNFVICIDNLQTGQKKNIEQLFSNRNFEFINSDISSVDVSSKFNNRHIDQIYHLASPASLGYINRFPVETALANSLGTKNLLDLAQLKNAKILFTSSSETYGDPLEHPQKETYWGNVNPIGVRSGYDESKRFGEALCMAYYKEHGIQVRITRLFNTYGPNSNYTDTRIIPRFISQALENQNLTVHGDGTQTRSFCYVSDTVMGLIKVMESTINTPFNIGNPDEYKIKEVAEIIIKLTGSKSKITFTKRPEDDPSVRKPDISKAKKLLNWSPTVTFKEGLLKTIKYFRDNE